MPSRAGVFLSFKTPYNSVNREDIKKSKNVNTLLEDLKLQTVGLAMTQVRRKAAELKERNFLLLATFFQRVCARTPLDEHYWYEKTITDKDGNQRTVTVEHRPDEQQVRMDWYILDTHSGNKILTAKQIADDSPEIFDKYNDRKSILAIKEMLEEKFTRQNSMKMSFSIGNDNPYFAVLEYGGYKVSSSEPKKSASNLYEHGVKNNRSIQAPLGMLRITEMELESIANSDDVSEHFYRQNTDKDISRAKLKQILKQLESTNRFDVDDLLKIIGA